MEHIRNNKIPFSWLVIATMLGLLMFSIVKDRYINLSAPQSLSVSFSVNRLIPSTHVIELDHRLISGFSVHSKGGDHVITSAVVRFTDGSEEKVFSLEGFNHADQRRVFNFPQPEGKHVEYITLHSYAPNISESSGLMTLSLKLPQTIDIQLGNDSDLVHAKI